MSVRFICPKCGGTVSTVVLHSYPPIYRYECTNHGKCDYRCEEQDIELKIVAPTEENQVETLVDDGAIIWRGVDGRIFSSNALDKEES